MNRLNFYFWLYFKIILKRRFSKNKLCTLKVSWKSVFICFEWHTSDWPPHNVYRPWQSWTVRLTLVVNWRLVPFFVWPGAAVKNCKSALNTKAVKNILRLIAGFFVHWQVCFPGETHLHEQKYILLEIAMGFAHPCLLLNTCWCQWRTPVDCFCDATAGFGYIWLCCASARSGIFAHIFIFLCLCLLAMPLFICISFQNKFSQGRR